MIKNITWPLVTTYVHILHMSYIPVRTVKMSASPLNKVLTLLYQSTRCLELHVKNMYSFVHKDIREGKTLLLHCVSQVAINQRHFHVPVLLIHLFVLSRLQGETFSKLQESTWQDRVVLI